MIGRLNRAGAERQMLLIASGLQNRGNRVTIVSLDGPGNLDEEARRLGLEVRIMEGLFRGLIWKAIPYIRYVRNAKPDVIYGFLPKQHLVITLLKSFTIPAKIVWGIRASKIDWSEYHLRSRIFFPLATKLSRWADAYIANSWSGADYHNSLGYLSKRMSVVPNGIDTEIFFPNTTSRGIIRSNWNLAEAVPIVGMLARFDPMKGNDDFLEVAAKVADAMPEARYVVTGQHTDVQAAAFWKRASTLGIKDKTLLFNSTSSPEVFLNGIDVLVSPSKTEGFPNTILEALACGTPVVATDVGDTRRILTDTACIAHHGDHMSLANSVVRLLSNSNYLSESKIESVVTAARYDKNQLVKQTEIKLRTIVNETSGE